MPSASQERFRQSWKLQELSGKPAQAWLVVRRTIATLLAIGLIGVCGWLIFSLFWVPKSYLAYWSAGAYQPLSAGPVKFACNDFAAIESLKDNFAGSNLVNPAEARLTKESLEENLSALANLGMRSKDACLVFVTAHGGVRDKEAYLLCEPGDRNSEIPVSDVLAALKNVPSGTKLLILDAGRGELAIENSADDDAFPALLQKAVKKSEDPSLWVLTANAPLERSHVSAELSRPVFGYMVSQGLRGEADRDHDGVIRLDELYNYVQSAVASWVKTATADGETQTPQLFHFNDENYSSENVPAQRLVNASKHAVEPEPTVEHVAEHEAEGEPGGIKKWLTERGQEAKERFSAKEEIHIFSHMLGIHEHDGHGEHGGPGEAHAAHPGGGVAEHGDAEHKNTSHDAKAEAKIETAAAARKQVTTAWQKAAQLEASVNLPPPGVVAPPLWRELLERLLWCDQFCASGVPADAKASWKQVAAELEGINQSLEAFAAYRLPARINAPAEQAISLALADRLSVIDPDKRLPKPLADFVKEFDRLLLQELPATFKDKLNALVAAQKTGPGLANYYEFQLLGLSKDSDVPSAALQLVLRTRRVGETVATDPLCGEGWLRAAVEAADRLRSEGERELLDRTSSNWEKQATDRLTAAAAGYESAFRNLELVRDAIRYRNATLLRAPDLVHRACLNGGDQLEIAPVEKVFSSLRELNKELADPINTNIDSLKRLRDQLESASAALERKADPANNAWRMANLLATTLPSPDLRGHLRGQLAATEEAQMATFKVPESEIEAVTITTLNEEQWKRVVAEFALQVDLARLAGCDAAALASLRKSLDGDESKSIEKLNEARHSLTELLKEVPSAIAASADGSGADRPAQLSQLRNALPQWLLLGPQQRNRIDSKNDLIAKLDRASWHDLLAWNSKRYRRAADDAPIAIDPFLHKASATFHELANAISTQPPLPASDPPALSIDSPAEVSLVSSDEATIRVKVKSSVSEEIPVWLIAQYNDKWLDVGGDVHQHHELSAAVAAKNLGEKASRYPLRPDAIGFGETGRIPAGDSGDYTVKIKRQPNTNSGGVTKLIVKAVSGESFVRRELAIELPGRESLDISVNAPPEFWTPDKQALHPLPNRVQTFSFDVVNRAKVAKKLDVSIVAPSRLPLDVNVIGIPKGAQTPETATKLLDAYGPLIPIGPSIPIDLPASGETVRIKLPAGDPRNDPKTNLLLPEKADPEQYPGVPLRYGLMILMTDRETKKVTIRPIEITPQRPTGYLEAVAHYNRATERLQIDVSAKNRDVIPSGGLQISAEVTGVSAQLPRSLTGEIKAPEYTSSLYAHLSPTAPPEVTARMNVDDYPRAFVFRFSRNTAPRDLAPRTDLAEVRIVSPPAGKAYKAPVKTLEVIAEVDAPEGSFGEGDAASNVAFGIDENQDRELLGDPVETRRSDRQVSVAAKSLSADGSLALDTRVSDFRVELSSGLADRKAFLLGRLMTNGKATWIRQPVEITLDGSPPIIHAALPPNREVETEDDLVVRVLTHQTVNETDLSGVRKVEAVFDRIATKDSKPAKWEEAVPDGANTWIVKLSTKDMGLGPQTVLVRATDNVGNVSEPLREPVSIVPKRPKAAVAANKEPPKPDVANVVTGKVQYGNVAVKAKVSLEPFIGPQVPAVVSDASGKFSFPKVPPGKYTLKASTPEAIRNRFRTAEMEVTVEPKPKTQAPVTVKLQ